jgi:Flp pilus assembly protein TadD
MNSTRDRILLFSLLIVLVTAATFWRVRTHDFITYDDNINTYDSPPLKRPDLTPRFFFWKAPYLELYIPVTYTAWSVIASVARILPDPQNPNAALPSKLTADFDPGPFHSANLALHILNALLVFWILRRLLRQSQEGDASPDFSQYSSTRRDIAAACGALLFALHPLQVEPVAWVTGLKDVLSTFFALLALGFYGAFLDLRRPAPDTKTTDGDLPEGDLQSTPASAEVVEMESEAGNGVETDAAPQSGTPWLWYLLATVCYLLALLSKPSTVVVPLLAGVLALLAGRSLRATLPTLGLWLLLTLPAIWIARGAQTPHELYSPLWARPLIALDALWFYISKLFWPVALRPEYSRTPRFVIESGLIYWTWIFPVAAGVLLWRARRTQPLLVVGALIFGLALSPVLGLVPFSFQYYSTVADRYSYLAMLGPALVVASLLMKSKWNAAYAVVGVWLLLLAGLSFRQTAFWRDSETLYRYTIAVNPRSWQARINLGALLSDERQFDRAEQLYREALKLQPQYPESYNNIGTLLKRRGKVNEAIPFFIKAAEVSPIFADAYYNLGQSYLEIKQYKYAILAFRRNAELRPDNLATQYLLAECYLRTKQWKQADIALQNAQKLSATPESFFVTTAVLMVKLDLPQMAIPYYVQALQYRPYDATLHNDLGSSLARTGKLAEAEKAIRNALKIKPDYAEAHNNLGMVLMAQKKLAPALQEFKTALKLNPDYAEAKQNLSRLLKQKI